jgi:2-polyprenyl-3-methyl-5-hydroxy-6-metoxy-1,4-benzoquinol methylase
MKLKYAIGKSSAVFMSDDSAIKIFNLRQKQIKAARGSYELCWLRETTCLDRLKGKLHFPQLLEVHEDHLGLRMTTVGESLFDTWPEHNLQLYIDQAHTIADTLESVNIQYFYPGMDPNSKRKEYIKFPLSNFCIQDGELSLIDFELANPVGSKAEENISERLKSLYNNYNKEHFRQSLINALTNPRECYEAELLAKLPDKNKFQDIKKLIPREVWKTMTTFNNPSEKIINEWKKYQKRYGMDDAINRVERMQFANVITSDHNVVDIGCNDGYISMLVAPMAKTITGVEPHVSLPTEKQGKPSNCKWAKMDFNTFLKQNELKKTYKKFDVLLSLAVSIQLRDFGGLNEQEIVDGYASLLTDDGIVIHETQKLADRPNNQKHTANMLEAFATKFEQIDHGQARSGGKREYYHFRKK